ncbi:MAG: beta-galactosidase, partial [Alistipes sp.]|nr:beta-galactosidase [Alistipes sp.]
MKKFLFSVLLLAIATACCNDAPKQIGALRKKTVSEVHNNLSVDCGTLDRDYADYHRYKEYLEPLGVRYIRLQAGWAKTEKVKGVYDFAWLDAIIDDAVSRGLEPWLQLSYGNPIYPGGGTIFLNGGWPTSKVAVDAWMRWAKATAERYKGKVHQWEIWNEPDGFVRHGG